MNIALVWASNDTSKYWNKILHNLISKWHLVLPVNPKEEFIETIKCYKSLSDIKNKIDIINLVTPAKVTLEVLKEALNLWYKKVWCQPGASDEKVLEFLKENNFDYIIDACIMIENIKKLD